MPTLSTTKRLLTLALTASLCAFGEPIVTPAPAAEAPAVAPRTPEPTPGARFLATLPTATREALLKDGQVVLDSKGKVEGGGMVRAVLRFDRPAGEVFAILTQPSLQSTYLPEVKESKTVGTRTAAGETTDMKVSVFIVSLSYRTQHTFLPEAQRMEWSLDPTGGDGLREQSGFFQLYALDEKTTIAEYGTRVALNNGFFDFFRSLGERGGVANALKATRAHVANTRL